MALERCISDIIDRYCISKLKAERISKKESIVEYEHFKKYVEENKDKYKDIEIDKFIDILLSINSSIWSLEAALKSGKEELVNKHYLMDKNNNEALKNIGITTILIRDFNNLRVKVKNLLNSLAKEGFIDIKSNHLSE